MWKGLMAVGGRSSVVRALVAQASARGARPLRMGRGSGDLLYTELLCWNAIISHFT